MILNRLIAGWLLPVIYFMQADAIPYPGDGDRQNKKQDDQQTNGTGFSDVELQHNRRVLFCHKYAVLPTWFPRNRHYKAVTWPLQKRYS